MTQKRYYFKPTVDQPIISNYRVMGFASRPCASTEPAGCSSRTPQPLRSPPPPVLGQQHVEVLSVEKLPLIRERQAHLHPKEDGSFPLPLQDKILLRGARAQREESAGNRLWPLRGWEWLTNEPGLNLRRQILGLWTLNNIKSLRKKLKFRA